MVEKLNNIKNFVQIDLWKLKLSNIPYRKRQIYSLLKIWFIAIREFIEDKCADKASALTYYSMLSLVPVIAILISIARGFGLDEVLERVLEHYLSGQKEVLEYVLPYAHNMLDGEGGGVITGISFVFLIYTVIRLLSNIEVAFNEIWKISEHRKWERKISDYLAVIMLGPLLLIISSSASVFVTSQVQSLVDQYEFLSSFKLGILTLLKLTPYVLIWILLTLLYLIFPNTRVRIIPALMGSILAGIAYNLIQQGFITFQFAFARYHAVYGTLAFLPLFLIWLHLSWLVVLFGAKFAYAVQNVNHWESDAEELKMSLKHRKKMVLLILHKIIKNFEARNGATTISELSTRVSIPSRYILEFCHELEKAGVLSKVTNNEEAYLPSFDIHKMDIHTVINLYESEGLDEFSEEKSKCMISIEKSIEEIDNQWIYSDANKLVKEL